MSGDFVCVFCRRPIAGDRRRSTRYCGSECRNDVIAMRKKDETLRRRNERELIVKVHEDWIWKFRHELLALAPAEAGGYQVGLWTGQMTYWFPSIPAGAKYRNTLLRTRSQHSFFIWTLSSLRLCPSLLTTRYDLFIRFHPIRYFRWGRSSTRNGSLMRCLSGRCHLTCVRSRAISDSVSG